MAATYSSFMTTRFYSPVFNTALFDGPLRIYFSQSYEAVALRVYHILQTQHAECWISLKNYTMRSKEHLFLLIYPEAQDLQMVFGPKCDFAETQEWEEGLAIGFFQPQNDNQFNSQVEYLVKAIKKWTIMNSDESITV